MPGTQLDVLVIGAGPAGAAAAITAAQRGLTVACCDKARFPRDKTCGDGLTTQALHLLERLGCSRADLAGAGYVAVREAVLVSPSGRTVHLPLASDGDHAGVVARVGLDDALVRVARRRGVEVRGGAAVVDLAAAADRVKACFDDGETVEARHVVAADGHWSTVRRRLHPDAPRDLGTWHAVRQYFDGVDDPRLWALFERDLLPGYAWVFPMPDGGANVGFGCLREGKRGRDLRALWDDVIRRPRLRAILGPRASAREPVQAWPIPTRYEPARLTDGPVLYAGDAAAVVDPMTGEGIAQAIETGILAANAMAAGGDAMQVARRYRRDVERVLGRDLRLAARLQLALASPRAADATLGAVDWSDWTRRSFARWLFEGYPRAVVLTPDRWHRRRFTAPGAFVTDSPDPIEE
ncbi:MAG: geranylgeranyl reductase family protein [Actinomycetota bacterium]